MIHRLLLLGLVVFGLAGALRASSQSYHSAPGYTESEIKAAFILNLFAFIEWPANRRPTQLCFTQSNATTAAVIQLLEARPEMGITTRQVVASELASGASAQMACDVLFLSRGLSEVGEIGITATGVLTISDRAGFAREGGMVEFERRPSRVGLIINQAATDVAGLRISSRLLSLATVLAKGDASDW